MAQALVTDILLIGRNWLRDDHNIISPDVFSLPLGRVPKTKDYHLEGSSESLCFCLYLALNPDPLHTWGSLLPVRPPWQI